MNKFIILAVFIITFKATASAQESTLKIGDKIFKPQTIIARIPRPTEGTKGAKINVDLYLESTSEAEKVQLNNSIWSSNKAIKVGYGKSLLARLMLNWQSPIQTCAQAQLSSLTIALFPDSELGIITPKDTIYNFAYSLIGSNQPTGLKVEKLECKYIEGTPLELVITGSSSKMENALVEWNLKFNSPLIYEPIKEDSDRAFIGLNKMNKAK